jgi:hypothetical protein
LKKILPGKKGIHLFWSIIIVCMVFPVYQTVNITREMSKETTSHDAFRWIKKNIPMGSTFFTQFQTVNLENTYYKTTQFAKTGQIKPEVISSPGNGYNYIILKNYRINHNYGVDKRTVKMLEPLKTFDAIKHKIPGHDLMILKVKPSLPYQLKKDDSSFFNSGKAYASINLGSEKEDSKYIDSSWGPAKSDQRGIFRWILGQEGNVYFKLSEKIKSQNSLKLIVHYFMKTNPWKFNVIVGVAINDKIITKIKIPDIGNPSSFTVNIPLKHLRTGIEKYNHLALIPNYSTPTGKYYVEGIGLYAPAFAVSHIDFALE